MAGHNDSAGAAGAAAELAQNTDDRHQDAAQQVDPPALEEAAAAESSSLAVRSVPDKSRVSESPAAGGDDANDQGRQLQDSEKQLLRQQRRDEHDVEAEAQMDLNDQPVQEQPDVEHVAVEDDPRTWSTRKKNWTFLFVCLASMTAAMTANVYFPAIESLQRDLNASQSVINLSVSLYILGQGVFPMIWSGISEIYGRKWIYIVSFAMFAATQIACALSKNEILFLVMRVLSSAGGSSVLTIGGGTLADIYDPHERGTRVGIYYLFPVLGPSLGTLLGGALALTGPRWRSCFWFMFAYSCGILIWACFFKDTFRKERSLAWRAAFKRAKIAAELKDQTRKEAAFQAAQRRDSKLETTSTLGRRNSPHAGLGKKLPWSRTNTKSSDAAAAEMIAAQEKKKKMPGGKALTKVTTETGEEIPIKISWRDVNPLNAVGKVLRQPSNLLAVFASGLLFGAQYGVTYTAALSFAEAPYNYNSIKIGLVILAFGAGNIVGSVGGGRYSDIMLARYKAKNGGKSAPEHRLRAALAPMPLVPLAFIAYAWTVDRHVPIYGPVIALFLAGLSSLWVYSTVLAYIVDSSVGMASTALSCNSLFRGLAAFTASQAGEPLLRSVGNGPLYTAWAILLLLAELALVAVCLRGQQWREKKADKKAEKKANEEAEEQRRSDDAASDIIRVVQSH